MQKGFTLVEILIVVAILGILAAIAYPSYSEYRKKTNRTDMRTEMMNVAQQLQRYQVANKTFKDAKANLGYANDKNYPASGTALYTVNLNVAADNRSWTLTATPIASASQKDDGNLVMNSNGEKCWTKGGTCTPSSSSSWNDN